MIDDSQPEFFPIAIGSYLDGWGPLDVEPVVAEIAALLQEFGVVTVPWKLPREGLTREAAFKLLGSWSAKNATRPSILYWLGHGNANSVSPTLIVSDTPRNNATVDGISPDMLAIRIANRGSEWGADRPWTAVVIDTCKSQQFVRAVNKQLHAETRDVLLFGTSADGGVTNLHAFRDALRRSVEKSFAVDLRISLNDLSKQLSNELPGSERIMLGLAQAELIRATAAPVNTTLDVAADIQARLKNLSDDERQHYVHKAHGGDNPERAWYFQGRVAEQRQIAAWLREHRHGLLAVTGEPGTGKSALLGFVFVQANSPLRHILVTRGLIDDRPEGDRPAAGAFHAALLLTGRSAANVVSAIGDIAHLPDHPEEDRLASLLPWLNDGLRRRAEPLTLLLDGLDEAAEPLAVAQLLHLLSVTNDRIRFVVGTRPFAGADPDRRPVTGDDLIEELQPNETIMVTRDPVSLERYVLRRLRDGRLGVPEAELADAARKVATQGRHEFLFAYLMVHEILARPQLLSVERSSLTRLLAGTHSDVFTIALRRLSALAEGNLPLLEALALTPARGVPFRDGIWVAMGRALTDTPASVDTAVADELTRSAAPYLMRDYEDDQTVYRLAHRTFAEQIKSGWSVEEIVARRKRIRQALDELQSDSPVNPYIARHEFSPLRIVALYPTTAVRPRNLPYTQNPPLYARERRFRAAREVTVNGVQSSWDLQTVEATLFVHPSGQTVFTLTVECGLATVPAALAEVVSRCVHHDLRVDGQPIAGRLADIFPDADLGLGQTLLPWHHIMVFLRRGEAAEPPPSGDYLVDLFALADSAAVPANRPEFSPRYHPESLNRENVRFGIVTAAISILYGHESNVEEAVQLTATATVATAASLPRVWREVRTLLSARMASGVSPEKLAQQLADLHVELALTIDLPFLSITDFDTALAESYDLEERVSVVNNALAQAIGALRSTKVATDIRERRSRSQQRRNRYAVGGIATMLGLPAAGTLAFLGINATNDNWSMWNEHYLPMYLVIVICTLGVAVYGSARYLRRQRVRLRRRRSTTS